MSEHRLYNKKHDINTDNTMFFYDQRAKNIENMDNPYVAVLLGDQDPSHAKEWNDFEKQFILPKLKITKKSSVLDIGCGIGRWAESVIPLAGYYFGSDFSAEMVNISRKRCVFPNENYDFCHASFNEIAENENLFFTKKFDRIIIGGVCMYINDNELEQCISGLIKYLDEHCIMYFTETVATEYRLTLNECPSKALKTTYDVIYRTPTEYNKLYSVFIKNGFKIKIQDYLPHLNNEKEFYETDRWYTILER